MNTLDIQVKSQKHQALGVGLPYPWSTGHSRPAPVNLTDKVQKNQDKWPTKHLPKQVNTH